MNKYNAVGLPWGGKLGIDVSDCKTSKEVLEKAKLNWYVEKCELTAKMPFSVLGNNEINETMGDFAYDGHIYRACPNGYATYRTDRNIPLGVVKSQYEVVQNIDAFNFIDAAIGENAEFQYAGCFGYGHKVFITVKLPTNTKVGDDPIDNYLVFSTSHDGSSSVDILFTPVRVFCLNCLNAGIQEASSHIRLRHTKSVKDRLSLGAEIVHISLQFANGMQQFYESLLSMKMTDDEVREYIAKLQLSESEFATITEGNSTYGINKLYDRHYLTLQKAKISTRKANLVNSIYDYYKNGIAQEHIVGTAWGAYNAITGYYNNIKSQEGEKRMNNIIFGSDRLAMSKALNLVVTYNKAA